MTTALSIWTIYDHPTDYPQEFIARRHEITATGSVPTNDILVSRTLDGLRAEMEMRGMYPLTREPDDDPCIVESWL